MKHVITILLALIPFVVFSQQEGSNDGLINKGSGILYFEGRPSFDPTPFTDASEFAIDLNTKKVYIYSGSGSVWNRYNAIDTISVIGDTTGIATQTGKIIYVNSTNEHWKVNDSGNFSRLVPFVLSDTPLTETGQIRQGANGALYTYDSSVSGERKMQYQYTVDSVQEILSMKLELGDRIKVKGTGAEYLVQADAVSGYTVDSIAVIPSDNKYAVLDSKDFLSVGYFGATGDGTETTGTDNTDAFQKAIDFQFTRYKGGKILIPADTGYYRLSKIYIKEGIFLEGVGNSYPDPRGSDLKPVRIYVTGDYGLVVGHNSYSGDNDPNRSWGVNIKNLSIYGSENSKAGLLIGSDVNYETVTQVQCENLFISGFDNPTVNQVENDKTTPAKGGNNPNFSGTLPLQGACGVLMLNGLQVTFRHVILRDNYYGFASTGDQTTTVVFENSRFVSNRKYGVNLLLGKGFTFTNSTVIEGNDEEGIYAVTPDTSTITTALSPINLGDLMSGVKSIRLIGAYLERNNITGGDYSVRLENRNEGNFIKDCLIMGVNHNPNDSVSLYYVNRGRNVIFRDNANATGTAGFHEIVTVNSDYVYYESEPTMRTDSVDNQTEVVRKGKNAPFYTGTIKADNRTAQTGADTLQTTLRTVTLPSNYFQTGGRWLVEAKGSFADNSNTKSLTVYVDTGTDINAETDSTNFYLSDFQSGSGDLGETGGTGTDGETVADTINAYKFTIDASNGIHRAASPVFSGISGQVVVEFDYYIPSSNSIVDRILFRSNNGGDVQTDLTIQDAWTEARVTFLSISGDQFWFYAAQIGTGLSYLGNGTDVFYLKNIRVYQTTSSLIDSETYIIRDTTGADFTLSGADSNIEGEIFTANSTQPEWGSGSVERIIPISEVTGTFENKIWDVRCEIYTNSSLSLNGLFYDSALTVCSNGSLSAPLEQKNIGQKTIADFWRDRQVNLIVSAKNGTASVADIVINTIKNEYKSYR